MDFVLDAPGLIENLVMCTAHASSQVRSAAHEVLTTTASEDTVATIAFRVLDLLETVGDWRGRVKAIEWINALIAGRLKELAEAAVQANPAARRQRSDSENALFQLQGGDEDLALGRDSVDLASGVEHAPGELAGVATMLSRHGVERMAACLDDRDAAPVLAARRFSSSESSGTPSPPTLKAGATAWTSSSTRTLTTSTTGGSACSSGCGVVARLVSLREDDDKATTVYADLLVQRILQTAGRAAVDAFDEARELLHPSDLHERVGTLLDVARERSARESESEPESPSGGFHSSGFDANGHGRCLGKRNVTVRRVRVADASGVRLRARVPERRRHAGQRPRRHRRRHPRQINPWRWKIKAGIERPRDFLRRVLRAAHAQVPRRRRRRAQRVV